MTLPADVATLEQRRASGFAGLSGLTHIPTDVFVWREGEPARREVTKIAGLPYRPAGLPWPLDPSDEPLTFVAQFCFADSRDLVPLLPGDVLLIFATGEPSSRPDVQFDLNWGAGLSFEWIALGDFSLVSADDMPPTRWPVQPCYGALRRMWDYQGVPDEISMYFPAIIEATKIGGLPPWLDEQDTVRLDQNVATPGPLGIYLCTLATLDAYIYASLPGLPSELLAAPASQDPQDVRAWRMAQLRESHLRRSRTLMIADAGLLNFYLDSSGSVRWTGHCQS